MTLYWSVAVRSATDQNLDGVGATAFSRCHVYEQRADGKEGFPW